MDENTSCTDSINGEDTALLPDKTRPRWLWSWLAMRYGTTRKCVSSKAALLVLLWIVLVFLLYGILQSNITLLSLLLNLDIGITYSIIFVGIAIGTTCSFPFAGFLADVNYGRYKVVFTSLCLLVLFGSLLLVVGGVAAFMQVNFHINTAAYVLYACVGILVVVVWLGFSGFLANVLQFGMDQLHDSPGEDRTLFIHWYVWAFNVSLLLVQIAWDMVIQPYHIHNNYSIIGYCLVALLPVVAVVVLALTLCLARQRRRWFLIEPGRLNPYKLIYRVTKFARQHKVPVQRSAFTYCEDERPSGLDLGKEKYGGCFTTEQVEDVKAFYGILKVLFSCEILYLLRVPAYTSLPVFSFHVTPFYFNSDTNHTTTNNTFAEQLIFSNGLFSPLLIFICIPLYLCLLRPFISQYVPGMLKRMGLGIVFVLLSLVALLSHGHCCPSEYGSA